MYLLYIPYYSSYIIFLNNLHINDIEFGDGSAFKVDGQRGNVYVGKAGDAVGTKKLLENNDNNNNNEINMSLSPMKASSSISDTNSDNNNVREALKFFFSDDGLLFRDLIIDEITNSIDALSRDVLLNILARLTGFQPNQYPFLIRTLIPSLSNKDQKVVESITKLMKFLLNIPDNTSNGNNDENVSLLQNLQDVVSISRRQITRDNLTTWIPLLREFAPNIRSFGLIVLNKLFEKGSSRVLKASADAIFGPLPNDKSSTAYTQQKALIGT